MHAFLLAILLAQPAATAETSYVYWTFPGPYGEQVRAALVNIAGGNPAHLLTREGQNAYLSGRTMPENLGCLANQSTCADATRGVLGLLGISARIDATAERTDDGLIVRLKQTSALGGDPVVHAGRGETMQAATAAAFAAVQGEAMLILNLEPADANLRLNGQPFGQGSGSYTLPAGKHTVEAPARQTVEQEVILSSGQVLRLVVDLSVISGKLTLAPEPPGAKVFLDGVPWPTPQTPRALGPGKYQLRVEAEGYETFSQTVTIKAATQHDLTLKLRPSAPPWRTAVKSPHRDTLAHGTYARLRFDMVSARDGDVGLEAEGGVNIEVLEQKQSIGLVGMGVAAGWRSRYLVVEALGLGIQTGSDTTETKLGDAILGELQGMTRINIRPGWVGLRYPVWRIEPYFLGGLEISTETLRGVTAGDRLFEVKDTRLLLGLEMGMRYVISPAFFAGLATSVTLWPGARTMATFTLDGGFAFDIPGLK